MNYNHNLQLTSLIPFLLKINNEMKFHLAKHDYKSVINAPNNQEQLILIFIDMNYVYNQSCYMRRQIFEAAELFNRAGGKVFGFFNGDRIMFNDVNTKAFTSFYIHRDYTADLKADDMRNIASQYKGNYTRFVFTSQDVIGELNWRRFDGDIILDVDGTNLLQINGQINSPDYTYTVVECILFYLAIHMTTKNINSFFNKIQTE